MKGQINQAILNTVFKWETTVLDMDAVDAAAEAIAELVASQPVSRIQAMAALVVDLAGNDYYVPVGGKVANFCFVCWLNNKWLCYNCSRDDCDHIKAVKLYLKQKGE